jgi:hypothetical protein
MKNPAIATTTKTHEYIANLVDTRYTVLAASVAASAAVSVAVSVADSFVCFLIPKRLRRNTIGGVMEGCRFKGRRPIVIRDKGE